MDHDSIICATRCGWFHKFWRDSSQQQVAWMRSLHIFAQACICRRCSGVGGGERKPYTHCCRWSFYQNWLKVLLISLTKLGICQSSWTSVNLCDSASWLPSSSHTWWTAMGYTNFLFMQSPKGSKSGNLSAPWYTTACEQQTVCNFLRPSRATEILNHHVFQEKMPSCRKKCAKEHKDTDSLGRKMGKCMQIIWW